MNLYLKNLLFLFCLELSLESGAQVISPGDETFEMRVVAGGFSDPWEVIFGPDGNLWVTESKGYKVFLIDPDSGKKRILIDLNSEKNFPRYDKIRDNIDGGKKMPQGGLMGMALHPSLSKGKPYVYLAFVYYFSGANEKGNGCKSEDKGCFYTSKIIRYQYDIKSQSLNNPKILSDTIPASNDHNGGRLLIAPVDGKEYLFYSIGDMGAGQFDNGGRLNKAQVVHSYEGKILRFNLEQDTDNNTADQWIPNDNPFNSPSQSAVWTLGHRNPQGLAYAEVGGKGRIYSSEHGPYSDDEINIIEKGKNYGHPLVIGFNDGNYNGLSAGVSDKKNLPGKWHSSYPLITDENINVDKIGKHNYKDPIFSLYPSINTFLTSLYEKNKSGNTEDVEWQSEAPSSIDVYTSSAIPEWKNSLLLPALKGKKLIRLRLNEAGDRIVGDTISYFKSEVRYRDIAISDNGLKIYAVTDSSAVTSGPTEKVPEKALIGGAVLEFVYNPSKKKDKNEVSKAKKRGINSNRNKND